MDDNRLKLQAKLEALLGNDHVYYQPPSNVHLEYPCFIYSKSTPELQHANNKLYFYMDSFNVIYIDVNPDNTMVEDFCREFQYVNPGASYVTDNLNHYVFDIYY